MRILVERKEDIQHKEGGGEISGKILKNKGEARKKETRN